MTDLWKQLLEDGTRGAGNAGPQISALLGHGAGDGRALQVALDVDDDTRVILKVDEATAVNPPPGLALPDHNRRHHLLTQLGLALLHGGHHHVTHSRARNLVEATLDALDGDDVQVLGARVVGAVHHGAHAQTEGRAELVAHRTTTATLRHDSHSLRRQGEMESASVAGNAAVGMRESVCNVRARHASCDENASMHGWVYSARRAMTRGSTETAAADKEPLGEA